MEASSCSKAPPGIKIITGKGDFDEELLINGVKILI